MKVITAVEATRARLEQFIVETIQDYADPPVSGANWDTIHDEMESLVDALIATAQASVRANP